MTTQKISRSIFDLNIAVRKIETEDSMSSCVSGQGMVTRCD